MYVYIMQKYYRFIYYFDFTLYNNKVSQQKWQLKGIGRRDFLGFKVRYLIVFSVKILSRARNNVAAVVICSVDNA